MRAQELEYELPEELIAQRPPTQRDGARLLVVAEPTPREALVCNFPDLVPPDALLVLNNTRVHKARVFGEREDTRGKVELLFLSSESVEGEADRAWCVLLRSGRRTRPGDRIRVGETSIVVVAPRDDEAPGAWSVEVSEEVGPWLSRVGHVPLPPYVRRPDEAQDEARYQTVFAAHLGSAAAPTAGLHLTQAMLEELAAKGVELGQVTLHVGAGTFRPVTAEHLDQHRMHSERFLVSQTLAAQLDAARRDCRPVVAVGTTVVRALESAADEEGRVVACETSTRLMIQPGYRFRVVSGLLTNFHAPRSTLLSLVYALGGIDAVQQAYRHALQAKFRFLSYGDAMWIPPRTGCGYLAD